MRVLTAAVLAPLVLLLLFLGPTWGWAVFLCLSAAQVTRELLAMTHPHDPASRLAGALLSAGACAASYWGAAEPRLFFSGIVLCLIIGAMLPLFRLGDMQSAAQRMLATMAAPLYVGVLLSCLALLRTGPGADGPRYVLFTLFIAWMGDTGGYTAGRLFGRTKLYEAVSPKKTREGLLGSVVFCVVVSVVGCLTYLPSLPVLNGAVLGLLGALLGQAGDLVESLLKRSTGVKDSGNILPGHGGLFDRVDALLVVAPLVYLHWLWFG